MKKYIIAILDFIKSPSNGIYAIFKRLIEVLMPLCGMTVKPFYGKEEFPWLQILEDNYLDIKEEMLVVYNNQLIPSVQEVNKNVSTYTTDNKWKTFMFWVYGNRIEKNCNLCPKTAKVIAQIPDSYTAFFSILEAGKNIEKHRGVYRGNTLAHLGLEIPQPITQCTFHVKDATKNWEEGKAFVFEDSYTHYVTNTAPTFRAVLIVEFRRNIPNILKPFDKYIQSKIRNSYITSNILKDLNA